MIQKIIAIFILSISFLIAQGDFLKGVKAVIKFAISKKGKVLFSIYDVTGARVKSLKQEYLNPGYYQEKLDTKGFSNGIYFVVLKQRDEQVSREFLLVR